MEKEIKSDTPTRCAKCFEAGIHVCGIASAIFNNIKVGDIEHVQKALNQAVSHDYDSCALPEEKKVAIRAARRFLDKKKKAK